MGRIITALKVQKRNPQRVNVYIDDEFAFGLSRIVAAWLYVGQEVSEDKIAQLQTEDGNEVAYQKALDFLSYRARSQEEVSKYLKDREFSSELIESTLVRLQNSGLLDDRRFAQEWVENRREYRPRSRRALVYELKQKGISDAVIHAAVDDLDEEEMAYRAAQKKADRLKSLEWPEFRQKLYAYLARRGFSYETSATVLTRIRHELYQNVDIEPHSINEEVDI